VTRAAMRSPCAAPRSPRPDKHAARRPARTKKEQLSIAALQWHTQSVIALMGDCRFYVVNGGGATGTSIRSLLKERHSLAKIEGIEFYDPGELEYIRIGGR
jgi:hypothetical protein